MSLDGPFRLSTLSLSFFYAFLAPSTYERHRRSNKESVQARFLVTSIGDFIKFKVVNYLFSNVDRFLIIFIVIKYKMFL